MTDDKVTPISGKRPPGSTGVPPLRDEPLGFGTKADYDKVVALLAEDVWPVSAAHAEGWRFLDASEARTKFRSRYIGAGFEIPYLDRAGKPTDVVRFRLLDPLVTESGKKQKYAQAPGSPIGLYIPNGTRALLNKKKVLPADVPLVIVEGEKKAAYAARLGIAAVGIGGVDSFRGPDGNLLPDLAALANDRDVRITPDSDCTYKPGVRAATVRLVDDLLVAGARSVAVGPVPDLLEFDKTGLDDFLQNRGPKAYDEIKWHRADSPLVAGWRKDADRARHEPEQPSLIAFTASELLDPIPDVRYLIDGLIPCEAYSLGAGAMSAGKTTFALSLAISRATGTDVLDLGVPFEPGPVVFVTYEDSANVIRGRYLRITQHVHAALVERGSAPVAKQFLARLARHFRLQVLSGIPGAQLVRMNQFGRPEVAERQVAQLLSRVGKFADREVMVVIDPLRLAFTGSQNDDNGADIAVMTLNRIATAYPDSGLLLMSHATKFDAKNQSSDRMEAMYGTSGSALWSQHARSNFYFGRPDAMKLSDLPAHVTREEREKRRVMTVQHARLSYGAEHDDKRFVLRHGVLVPAPVEIKAPVSMVEMMRKGWPFVVAVIDHNRAKGMRYVAKKTLENDPELQKALGLGSKQVRELLDVFIDQGWLAVSGETNKRDHAVTEAGRTELSRMPT